MQYLKCKLSPLGGDGDGEVWNYAGVTVIRFGPKVGQIGPKWDKSGDFSNQIQYI